MSKREDVLSALFAALAGVGGATVARNLALPTRIPAAGLVILRVGTPGEPDVSLSPLTYLFSHRIPLEIDAYESATLTREQVLDAMTGAIGAAVMANRTLGGFCDWIEAEAPVTDDIEALGALPGRFADLAILAVYATTDPLN